MKIFIYIFVYFEQEYKVCRGVKKKNNIPCWLCEILQIIHHRPQGTSVIYLSIDRQKKQWKNHKNKNWTCFNKKLWVLIFIVKNLHLIN